MSAFSRAPYSGRVDVDADAAGAELLGGGNDDAAVAGAEIVEDVVLADLGHLQHLRDDLLVRGHIGNFRLLFEKLQRLLRHRRDDGQQDRQHESQGEERMVKPRVRNPSLVRGKAQRAGSQHPHAD